MTVQLAPAWPAMHVFKNLLRSGTKILFGAGVTITPASLTGINLFIGFLPDSAYSANSLSALSNFSASGGTILLTAEFNGFDPTAINNVNAALTSLASPIQVMQNSEDLGFRAASGTQIVAGPLTTGVANFSYAAASTLTGGSPVFKTVAGDTFIATSGAPSTMAATPEPSTVLLTLSAGIGLASFLHRRRS